MNGWAKKREIKIPHNHILQGATWIQGVCRYGSAPLVFKRCATRLLASRPLAEADRRANRTDKLGYKSGAQFISLCRSELPMRGIVAALVLSRRGHLRIQ